MKLADILRVIRAVREADSRSAVVSIDRTSNGAITFGVRCSGARVKDVAKKAQKVYDDLAKRYAKNGEK